MAATPTGGGYYLLDAKGNVYAFGDAKHLGNGSSRYVFTGIAADPDGAGYWLVNTTGDVYGFDAIVDKPWEAHESTTNCEGALGIAANKKGGYWVLSSRRGGSSWVCRSRPMVQVADKGGWQGPAVGIAAHPAGDGFWVASRDASSPAGLTLNEARAAQPTPPAGASHFEREEWVADYGPYSSWKAAISNPKQYAEHYRNELTRLGWTIVEDWIDRSEIVANRGRMQAWIRLGEIGWWNGSSMVWRAGVTLVVSPAA